MQDSFECDPDKNAEHGDASAASEGKEQGAGLTAACVHKIIKSSNALAFVWYKISMCDCSCTYMYVSFPVFCVVQSLRGAVR